MEITQLIVLIQVVEILKRLLREDTKVGRIDSGMEKGIITKIKVFFKDSECFKCKTVGHISKQCAKIQLIITDAKQLGENKSTKRTKRTRMKFIQFIVMPFIKSIMRSPKKLFYM